MALFLGLLVAGQAVGHEGIRRRPVAEGPIDPAESFQFPVVSGAGGHFHTLLPFSDLNVLFAGTHLGLFRSEDRGLPPHPRWWGVVTGFAFLSRPPEVVLAVTHEGVVAASRLAGGEWVPGPSS